MTVQNWHSIQSTHNKTFADDVSRNLPTKYPDWLIIALFYSALHLVDAYCIRHNIVPPKGHGKRLNTVKMKLPQILNEYDGLFALSLRARYELKYSLISKSEIESAWQFHQIIFDHIGGT